MCYNVVNKLLQWFLFAAFKQHITFGNKITVTLQQCGSSDFTNCKGLKKAWDYNNHWVKSVQIRSFFWSIFSCIRTEYRKVRARKNSVFGHFSRSEQWRRTCTQQILFFILTLYFAMSYNCQTHFKNLAANAARLLKCVWSFYDTVK